MSSDEPRNVQISDSEGVVEDLLSKLTLKEKVSLLSGLDWWRTVPIERLGIPSLAMIDGPHGVRTDMLGSARKAGPTTCFPTGVSMAATWNPELVERVGAALGEETRAMGCDILLGPCVNIVRTPLAGRNFETYSEDPYLAGRIGAAWVKGVQSQQVGTSLKHFACNNQETERLRGSSVVDERALREIYLPAFEAIVKEARPWTVMSAYNRINGVYASQNRYLLNDVLRGEWGFDGMVMSDWGGNHSTVESVLGGLDLEMPGPARYYGHLLVDAVLTWQIPESVVDDCVRRIVKTLARSGKLGAPAARPRGAVNTPEHQRLAREVAQEAITLLKNDNGALPLRLDAIRSIAVIGPNAAEARLGGGGSSYVEPPYRVSPLEGLRARAGGRVEIKYEQGCDNFVVPPVMRPDYLTPASGTGIGLFGEYFNNLDLSGQAALQRVDRTLEFRWWRSAPADSISKDCFSVRWTGTLAAPTTGRHMISLTNTGVGRVFLDGGLVCEGAAPAQTCPQIPMNRQSAYVDIVQGKTYGLRMEFIKRPDDAVSYLRLGFAYAPRPEDDRRLERAVELAQACDVAIVFAGFPEKYETEDTDRPHMHLTGRQTELIRAVARANRRTVVVLNCGAPVEMPWLDDVSAVLLAYYPGMEGGHAIASILVGDINPSGKLPITLPRRYEDNPTYTTYPGTREAHYGEGIFVGYRYYDMRDISPLFPFGHGLSYTTFDYSDLRVPDRARLGESLAVSVAVTNRGTVDGKEVVQLYVQDMVASLPRPPKELKGFCKLDLKPGETKVASFVLDPRALSFYDPYQKRWVQEPGEFTILVGSSSRDIRARATVLVS